MAPVALKDGHVFQPSERHLLSDYLAPKVGLEGCFIPGLIEEGVDVFLQRPRTLHFWPIHRRKYDEVWGFFFAAQPAAGERCPAPGGCWVRYGPERKYFGKGGVGGEAVAYRCLFAYRIMWKGGAVCAPMRWRMEEYRLNTDAAAFRPANPGPDPVAVGVVFVLHLVFRKPVLPPLPPPFVYSSESEEERSIVDQELDELVLQLRALTEGK